MENKRSTLEKILENGVQTPIANDLRKRENIVHILSDDEQRLVDLISYIVVDQTLNLIYHEKSNQVHSL